MDRIRIAQIGVGYWGKNLLRNFAALPDAEVVLACDQRKDILAQVAENHPDLELTSSHEDVFSRPDVDAVVIATEVKSHFDMASKALNAGKHVFVEKPMTETVAQAEALVALAKERDLKLMVGHLLLYHPAFDFVHDQIVDGELGDVHYMYSTRVNLGIVRQHENAFQSLAPHDISVALRFINASPVGVSAQGQSYLQPGIADVAFATVFFEEGKLAHIHTSWLDPHKIRKVTVIGSQKMAVIDDMEQQDKVVIFDKGVDIDPAEPRYSDFAGATRVRSGDVRVPHFEMQEPLRLECAHFVESIRNDHRPLSDGENGLAVVRVLDAAQRSLENKGATVDV